MQAIILSVGDELVLGQTVDTNSAWISQQLAAAGCSIAAHCTVGDDQSAIEDAIRDAAPRCDVLLISGGIGPTEDDLTRQALAAVMGVNLVLNESWLAHLEEFFRRINRPMSSLNRIQAMIPRGATMIENTAGTAAGIEAWIKRSELGVQHPTDPVMSKNLPGHEAKGRPLGRVLTKMGLVTREQVVAALTQQKTKGGLIGGILREMGIITDTDIADALALQAGQLSDWPMPGYQRHSTPLQSVAPSSLNPEPRTLNPATHVFVLPGVPKEMKIMFQRSVLPHVVAAGGGAVILSRTLHTFGLGESAIADKLKSRGELMNRGRNPSVGTTVAGGIVSLRINARFASRSEAERKIDETVAECRAALGDLIFGEENETLPAVLARMLLERKGTTVATAESCTGGLLAKMLTDTPSSSAYFTHGWVTYANPAKRELLGVPEELLAAHGAVSEPVVRAMAEGAQRRSGATYALSVSGIAGPDGGTAAKPVGTVCFGLAHPGGSEARTIVLTGDREMIRDRSAKMALTILRFHMLGRPLPV